MDYSFCPFDQDPGQGDVIRVQAADYFSLCFQPGKRSGESNSSCTEMCGLVFSYCFFGGKKFSLQKSGLVTVIGRAGKDSRRPPYFYLEPAGLRQRAPETHPDMSGMAGRNLKS